jgi:hypothetical protein
MAGAYHELLWSPWNAQHQSYIVRFTIAPAAAGVEEELPSEIRTQLSKAQAVIGDATLNHVKSLNTLTQGRLFSAFAMLLLLRCTASRLRLSTLYTSAEA